MERNILYLKAAHGLSAVASELAHGGAPSEQVYAILDRVFSLTDLANKETEKLIARLGRRPESESNLPAESGVFLETPNHMDR